MCCYDDDFAVRVVFAVFLNISQGPAKKKR